MPIDSSQILSRKNTPGFRLKGHRVGDCSKITAPFRLRQDLLGDPICVAAGLDHGRIPGIEAIRAIRPRSPAFEMQELVFPRDVGRLYCPVKSSIDIDGQFSRLKQPVDIPSGSLSPSRAHLLFRNARAAQIVSRHETAAAVMPSLPQGSTVPGRNPVAA